MVTEKEEMIEIRVHQLMITKLSALFRTKISTDVLKP